MNRQGAKNAKRSNGGKTIQFSTLDFLALLAAWRFISSHNRQLAIGSWQS